MKETTTTEPGGKLRAAHEEWIRAGSPKPTKETAKRVVAAYLVVAKRLEALEAEKAKLLEQRSEAILDIVRTCGRGRLDLGPQLGVQIPMAKDGTLWLRSESVSTARKVL